jgi:Family of unknown function (DUF5767)
MSYEKPYNQKNISLTTTDMGVDLFANEEKLVSSDKREYFDKDEYLRDHPYGNEEREGEGEEEYNLDDDADKYSKSNVFNHNKHALSDENTKTEEKKHYVSETEATTTEKHSKKYHASETDDIDPDDESNWTKEERLLRRLDMLRKLGELQEAGVTLSQVYSLNSDYKTMKYEYELHSNIRAKRNAMNWMSNMTVGIIRGVELLNDNVNPFDLKFEGMWSNKVQDDINNYYDVLGEIYEKYSSPGKKMAPELRLFLMLTGSAVTIQMHKGMANIMAGNSNVSGDLASNPDKYEEMRKKKNDDQEKINQRFEQDHKTANKEIIDMAMIRKKEQELKKLRENGHMKDQDYLDQFHMAESAASATSANKMRGRSSNELKSHYSHASAMQQALLQQQKKRNDMAHDIKSLMEIDNEIDKMDTCGNQIIHSKPKKIKKTKSSTSTSSSSPSLTTSVSKSDNVSMASTAVSVQNPDIDNIIGTRSHDSSVKQYGVVNRNTAEKHSAVTLSNSKNSGTKKRGKQTPHTK